MFITFVLTEYLSAEIVTIHYGKKVRIAVVNAFMHLIFKMIAKFCN
jgi:hypothetical protein